MTDTVIMVKKQDENAPSLYRRFVKHFRSSGIQTSVKRNKFHDRKPSKNVRRKDCINRLEQRKKYEEAYRLGKIQSPHKHKNRG